MNEAKHDELNDPSGWRPPADGYAELATDDPAERAVWLASCMATHAAQRKGGMGGIARVGKDRDAVAYQRNERELRRLVNYLVSANNGDRRER